MERNLIPYVPELEHDELDRRLRRLTWPGAPPHVRQRGLEAIMRAARTQSAAAQPPARVERVQRFEVTRWAPALRTRGWSAPRRQPRFAITL
jgi:hypothetical protein